MLTDKYLDGIPPGSRAAANTSLSPDLHDRRDDRRTSAPSTSSRAGAGRASRSWPLAWTLRDPRMTSTLCGASSVAQLEDTLAALAKLDFSDDELVEIDRYATDAGINIWSRSSSG